MKTVLITGATGAIGKAVTEKICQTPGITTIVTGRNYLKTAMLISNAKSIQAPGNVTYGFMLDFAEMPDHFEYEYGDIDILIINHAIAPRERLTTDTGIELQWATNVLSYYWFLQKVKNHLKPGARIILVSSCYAGDLDLSDPEFIARPYDQHKAYRASKQAIRMITAYMAEEYQEKGITINSIRPGGVPSNLTREMNIGADDTPEVGAESILNLAFNPDLQATTGKYFDYTTEQPCPFIHDQDQMQKLMTLIKNYQVIQNA